MKDKEESSYFLYLELPRKRICFYKSYNFSVVILFFVLSSLMSVSFGTQNYFKGVIQKMENELTDFFWVRLKKGCSIKEMKGTLPFDSLRECRAVQQRLLPLCQKDRRIKGCFAWFESFVDFEGAEKRRLPDRLGKTSTDEERKHFESRLSIQHSQPTNQSHLQEDEIILSQELWDELKGHQKHTSRKEVIVFGKLSGAVNPDQKIKLKVKEIVKKLPIPSKSFLIHPRTSFLLHNYMTAYCRKKTESTKQKESCPVKNVTQFKYSEISARNYNLYITVLLKKNYSSQRENILKKLEEEAKEEIASKAITIFADNRYLSQSFREHLNKLTHLTETIIFFAIGIFLLSFSCWVSLSCKNHLIEATQLKNFGLSRIYVFYYLMFDYFSILFVSYFSSFLVSLPTFHWLVEKLTQIWDLKALNPPLASYQHMFFDSFFCFFLIPLFITFVVSAVTCKKA